MALAHTHMHTYRPVGGIADGKFHNRWLRNGERELEDIALAVVNRGSVTARDIVEGAPGVAGVSVVTQKREFSEHFVSLRNLSHASICNNSEDAGGQC